MVPCSTAATVTLENSAINYSDMYCYYYSRPFMQAKRNSQLGHCCWERDMKRQA